MSGVLYVGVGLVWLLLSTMLGVGDIMKVDGTNFLGLGVWNGRWFIDYFLRGWLHLSMMLDPIS